MINDSTAPRFSASVHSLTERDTCLVATSWANGESGHVCNVPRLAAAVATGSFLHLDAAQAAGRIPVNIGALESFEKSIHVSDLKISDKVQVITPAGETVAKVQPPRDVEAELAVPVEEKVEEVIAASTEAKSADEAEDVAEKPKAEAKEETKAKKE